MTVYSGIGIAGFRRIPICALLMILLLTGCGPEPKAPSPTVNPHPHEFIRLKITVEKSAVNRIEVSSDWTVSNLSCAPLVYPAGNRIVKQVETMEKVSKVDDYYVATISVDRFLPDRCHWSNDGVGVDFFHDRNLLSTTGINADVLEGKRVDKMTCLTKPFAIVATCGSNSKEAFLKSEDKHAFNATVELMK